MKNNGLSLGWALIPAVACLSLCGGSERDARQSREISGCEAVARVILEREVKLDAARTRSQTIHSLI